MLAGLGKLLYKLLLHLLNVRPHLQCLQEKVQLMLLQTASDLWSTTKDLVLCKPQLFFGQSN